MFEPDANLAVDKTAAQNREPQDEAAILSQVGVLQSRELAQRVIDKLQLQNVNEFNTSIVPDSKLSKFLENNLPWLSGGRKGEDEEGSRQVQAPSGRRHRRKKRTKARSSRPS